MIDCCAGLMGKECLKKRCKSRPDYKLKFKTECINIDTYIVLPKTCKVDIPSCEKLHKGWVWIVILVIVIIVIIAITILIYIVYNRKFRRPDKKKNVEYNFANEANLESHVIVETKGSAKKSKKNKTNKTSGSNRNSRKKKTSPLNLKQNSFESRTPKVTKPVETEKANTNVKMTRSSIRRAVA